MSKSSKKSVEISKLRAIEFDNEIYKRRRFEEKMKRMAGDSNTRMELQTYIGKEVRSGKTKEEILKNLSAEEKYEKYSEFFESYINNHIVKFQKEKKAHAIEDIEK